MLRNTESDWGWPVKVMHWITPVLILLAWWTMEMRHEWPKGSPERDWWMGWHVTNGLLLWLVALLRVGWRLAQPTPRLMIARWQRVLSHWIQGGLYGVLLIMPLTGFLARQYGAHTVSFFSASLPTVVGENNELSRFFAGLHEDVLWPLLLALTGVHVLAALWHHFVLRDEVLRGMWRGRR